MTKHDEIAPFFSIVSCPSSGRLYLDDCPLFGSSLAHLEPELKLFEVDDLDDDGDDELSHHYFPNFKQL